MHERFPRRTTLVLLGLWALVVMLSIGLTVAIAAGPASAQPVPTETQTPTNDTTVSDAPGGERIQEGLVLVDAEYDPGENGTGTATVTLRVETPVAVTLADAGKFQQGGEIQTRTDALGVGTHTLRLPVTETESGAVGVTVSTPETLYAVPIQESDRDPLFGGTPGWGTVRIAGIGSGLGVLFALGGEAYRRRSGGRKEVRQRA